MYRNWQALTKITGGAAVVIERVRMVDDDVAIEGQFEVPPLAALPAEDQLFVAAFVRSHGSIKDMEALYGVSYPTIKNRLNRIAASLPMAEIEPPAGRAGVPVSSGDVLAQLERGEVSGAEAVARLRAARKKENP